jgi:hypothetical protein
MKQYGSAFSAKINGVQSRCSLDFAGLKMSRVGFHRLLPQGSAVYVPLYALGNS